MGRSDSPLRDRVVFIDGAPRSGTTWLVTLLATHPEIAGVAAESHLFDFGVDRLFDNFEGRDRALHGLASFVERDELVDLARDACDRVLVAMRAHVSGGTDPGFVVEKTPVGARADGLDLERKLECYPDAWYLHIVRDREAVIRSLMRAPFMADSSYESCAGLRDRVVCDIRRVLGEAPRYRELPYERLREDPVAACAEVFEWLGLETADTDRERLAAVARERVSEMGAPPPRPEGPRVRRLARRVRNVVDRVTREPPPPPPDPLPFLLTVALRNRDREGLAALLAPDLELVRRMPGDDAWLEGEAAREAVQALADEAFGRKYVSEWWATSGAGDGEWWTTTPGRPFAGLFFSALGGDGTRVDLALGVGAENGLVTRLAVVSAGPFGGRDVT